jgi:hypothetical protein
MNKYSQNSSEMGNIKEMENQDYQNEETMRESYPYLTSSEMRDSNLFLVAKFQAATFPVGGMRSSRVHPMGDLEYNKPMAMVSSINELIKDFEQADDMVIKESCEVTETDQEAEEQQWKMVSSFQYKLSYCKNLLESPVANKMNKTF